MVDKMVKDVIEVLENEKYSYSNNAVREICERSYKAKERLENILSKHPNWNATERLIQFDEDYCRKFNRDAVQNFINFLINSIGINMWDSSYSARILRNISSVVTDQFFDEYQKDLIDQINEDVVKSTNNEHFKLRTNEKSSKAIRKICVAMGWDKFPNFDREYASLCDNINPIKIKRHTCISLNPVDFLYMSNGTSWNSCHSILYNDYDERGCYSSGTISYMLDENSFLFYTVDKDYNGNKISFQPKIQREVFSYKDGILFQSRLYPQSNDCGAREIYKEIREIVQKVIADCLDMPNLWKTSKKDICDVVKLGSGATCYPDWHYSSTGSEHCSLSRLNSAYTGDVLIELGTSPICIDCGYTHDRENNINCCYDGYYCEDCGCLLSEDEVYYVDGYAYCHDCVEYCEHCEEYTRGSTYEVRDSRGNYIYVCEHCAENYYRSCDHCDEYHDMDVMEETEDGYWLCPDCMVENTVSCEHCGGVYYRENENLRYYENFDKTLCEECYEELMEDEENEEAA